MRRRIMTRMRENPLGCLSALLAVSIPGVAMWLLFTSWSSSGIDANTNAVVQALGMLEVTFMAAMLWNTSSVRAYLIGTGAEDIAATPDRNRGMRLSTRTRRIAFCVWVVIFVLALAQLVAALSGNLDVSYPLAMAVAGLSLIGVIAVFVAVMGRQR